MTDQAPLEAATDHEQYGTATDHEHYEALVVGAGVYTIHREHVRRRQISALSVARPETTGGEAGR